MLLHHSLRHAVWHLRIAHGGIALRVGRSMSVLLIVACLAAALGHAIISRGVGPDEQDEMATDEA